MSLHHPTSDLPLDRFNQSWYAAPGSVAGMATQEGFTDEGERAAYGLVAEEMRDRPILDLGVGPGRTVAMLRSISEDYVGIDYLAPMVDAARGRHPRADIRLGDARELGDFASGSQAMVVFSYHGIDSVGHDDRQRVLAEALRVLEPGGVFWFSTLNLTGPAARYRPWRPLVAPLDKRSDRWLRRGIGWARGWGQVPFHTLRYWRGQVLAEAGSDWAVAPFFAGGWRLVTHYVSLDELLRELETVGFEPGPDVFDDAQGRRLAATDDLHGVFSFSVLARKPMATTTPDVGQRTDDAGDADQHSPMDIHALLITDELADIAIVRDSLANTRAGSAHIVYATTLAEGVQRLARGGMDIVLLDLSLPDSEGEATLAGVRQVDPQVPVLVIAGDPRNGQAPTGSLFAPRFILEDRVDCHRLVDVARTLIREAAHQRLEPLSHQRAEPPLHQIVDVD